MKKIAIVGPESTGKTTLAEQLASELVTVWVPEYARTFLENLDRPYVESDLEDIAKGQLHLEKELAKKANDHLICDTNLLVIQIWSLYKYERISPQLESLIELEEYDLHLLTQIDLPWAPDPMRENADLGERQELFQLYEQALLDAQVPYKIVSGPTREIRLNRALEAISSHFTD